MKLDKWLRCQLNDMQNIVEDLMENGEEYREEKAYMDALSHVWDVRQEDRREMRKLLSALEEEARESRNVRKDITAVEPMEFWKGVEYAVKLIRERIGI